MRSRTAAAVGDVVKKLLAATSGRGGGDNDNDRIEEEVKPSGRRKRKRQQLASSEADARKEELLSRDEIVDRYVHSMLAFDRTLSVTASSSFERRKRDFSKEAKRQRKAELLLAGTSCTGGCGRTAAFQAARIHEPTFNKGRYKREKKERMLREIAKMLARNDKKRSKKKDT